MENYSETPLEDWINSDAELSELLEHIDQEDKTDMERAKIVFHRLCEKYNLPKYPDNIDSRETEFVGASHLYDPISVYEVLGKIKFSNNNPEEIKSNVLFAIYLVKNKYEPFIDEEIDNYLGQDELAGFGYKGEDIDVELVLIKEGESWFEKGCTFFVKE